MFAHAVIISSKSTRDQAVLTVYTSRHFIGMLFASKAIIYLNEERGRAARSNFFTAIELARVEVEK